MATARKMFTPQVEPCIDREGWMVKMDYDQEPVYFPYLDYWSGRTSSLPRRKLDRVHANFPYDTDPAPPRPSFLHRLAVEPFLAGWRSLD